MFLTSRVWRLSEGRRRNLDYGEAQSFQDLLLCRSLRLVGDELHAGLAGSSWISVQDLQTNSPTLRRRHLLNMPASSDQGVASETTYRGRADATTSRTRAPAERPGLPPSSETTYMLTGDGAALRQPPG